MMRRRCRTLGAFAMYEKFCWMQQWHFNFGIEQVVCILKITTLHWTVIGLSQRSMQSMLQNNERIQTQLNQDFH